jgi:hypothetical protein
MDEKPLQKGDIVKIKSSAGTNMRHNATKIPAAASEANENRGSTDREAATKWPLSMSFDANECSAVEKKLTTTRTNDPRLPTARELSQPE